MSRPNLVCFCDWSQLSLAGDDDRYRPLSRRSDDVFTFIKGKDLSQKLEKHKRFLAALTKGERAIAVGREQNGQTGSRHGHRRRTDGRSEDKTASRAASASSVVGRRSPWPVATIEDLVSKKTLCRKYEIPQCEEDTFLERENPVGIEPRLLATYKWRRKGGHVVLRDMLVPTGDGLPCRKAYVDVHLPKIECEGPVLRLTHRH
ncbi:Hypp4881 [Branchiostoma lanceolatum]|uniref:Hypp4881 protein n=1 Tax=Branchiostoma lanceolatum TaxID=7740 RepID=A0A8K0ABM1_BRALA|nr:Hypp4881 [Branchiostoma lanceolatum]